MNTPTAETYLPPLGHHQHDEVGRELQAALVELIDLSLIGKQLHWSVSGPLFRSLHLQLDELVESWPDLADTAAERPVTIGFWPDGQARAVAEGSELTGLEPGPVQDHMFLLADRSERERPSLVFVRPGATTKLERSCSHHRSCARSRTS